MFRRLLPVVLVCAFAAFATPAQGAARWLGFSDNSTLTHDLTPAQDAWLLKRAGANSVRITVDWSWVQARGGRIDLGMYDPIYRAYMRRNIRPVLVVMGAPRWAWPPWVICLRGQTCHYPPDRTKDVAWAGFVRAVAERFGGAAAIEVWNEPNLRLFWAGEPAPARYTELLRTAREAVKSVRPRMPVLGASLAGVQDDVETSDTYGLRPFLRAMYANGARGLMDGISVHAYPQRGQVRRVYEVLRTTLQIRDEAGDGAPLWVTEVGASTTGGYSEIAQAAVFRAVLPTLVRHPQIAGVFVHTLLDPRAATGVERGYGIVSADRRTKLAFCAVATAFGAAAPCAVGA